MPQQGIVGTHFQSDGMDVQPKKENEMTVAKGAHYGVEMQHIASSSQVLEQDQSRWLPVHPCIRW